MGSCLGTIFGAITTRATPMSTAKPHEPNTSIFCSLKCSRVQPKSRISEQSKSGNADSGSNTGQAFCDRHISTRWVLHTSGPKTSSTHILPKKNMNGLLILEEDFPASLTEPKPNAHTITGHVCTSLSFAILPPQKNHSSQGHIAPEPKAKKPKTVNLKP